MMTFRQTLERERDQLRSMRVAIRSRLDWFARGGQIGDHLDTRRAVAMLQNQLRASDRDWAELNAKLGHDVGTPPVDLRLTMTDRVALRRQASRPKVTPPREVNSRAMPGRYVTKVMRSGM
jgi:hypothetical protein